MLFGAALVDHELQLSGGQAPQPPEHCHIALMLGETPGIFRNFDDRLNMVKYGEIIYIDNAQIW